MIYPKSNKLYLSGFPSQEYAEQEKQSIVAKQCAENIILVFGSTLHWVQLLITLRLVVRLREWDENAYTSLASVNFLFLASRMLGAGETTLEVYLFNLCDAFAYINWINVGDCVSK